jgi:hypothetical protein
MSVGQPSTSCLTTFTGRRKRSLETVLIQSTCQALYPCEDENISVLQGGAATTKLLRETVVRSNKIRKLLPSKSNNQLDSMCSIFLSTTSVVNMSESLVPEKKQTRPRRKTATTDYDKRDKQNTHTKKETVGHVAKRKLRSCRKDRTLANFEHVDKGKRKSSRINTEGQVDPNGALEKLISHKVTCYVTSPGERNSSSERKTSDHHLEQEKKQELKNRKLINKLRDENRFRNRAKNSKVDSKVKSNANKRREEQFRTVDVRQEITHHDQSLTCEETIHPRRSQRTPKPITDRLTINWEDVKSCHQGCAIEQARKITFLSSTKQCASGKTLIRNQQKHDKRIQTTSARKSSRKIKRMEQLVITWDNNKRYHSRALTEYFTRKSSDTCAFHRACIPSEQPIQVLLSENLVRNLDTTRFQEADCNSLLNTTTKEQQNIVTLDNTIIGTERCQNVRKAEEEVNPVPKLNVIQQSQPNSQSVLRRSRRKPQPTARFTVTWTDQCAVASSQNIITTPEEKYIQHRCNIAVSKVSSTSACDGNHAPCFNSKDITSLSQSTPTVTEMGAISEDVLKSQDKTLDASTKQNNIEICDVLNLSVSPHNENKELQHNGGSLLVTSPRIKNVKDKFCIRKSSRKAPPTDRFTITWSKRERSSKLENTIAPATKTVSGYQHTSNSPHVLHQEGTEVSKQMSSSSLSIHQRDTHRATTGDFDNDDDWTNEEISLLWHTVMAGSDPTASDFWNNVAQKIKTKNATECHNRWFCMDRSFNYKGGTRAKKTDTGRGKNFLARSNYMNNHDVHDIFNATPMLGNSLMYQRLPTHIVLPQLEDFNSPIIRSPAIIWNKDDGNVLHSPVAACQKIISRRSPILDKKGYKGYLKSLSRQCRFFTKKKKSLSQVDTARFAVKKKKTVNMPLRATFADGNIKMSATLHDGNLELHGPSDSDLEDLGLDPKSFDENCEMEYIS